MYSIPMLLGVIDSLITYFGMRFLGLEEGNPLIRFLILLTNAEVGLFVIKIILIPIVIKIALEFSHRLLGKRMSTEQINKLIFNVIVFVFSLAIGFNLIVIFILA